MDDGAKDKMGQQEQIAQAEKLLQEAKSLMASDAWGKASARIMDLQDILRGVAKRGDKNITTDPKARQLLAEAKAMLTKMATVRKFSRPGAPDTFAVEDRFYFGKGRKAKFAWQPEITNEIRRHELGIRTAEENLRSASKEGKWAVAKSFCNQAKNHYAALADLYSQLARLVTNPRKGI